MAPREKTYFANPCDDERVWPVAEASGTSVSRAAFSAIAISMSAIPEPKPALPSEYHDWSEASRIATSSLVTGTVSVAASSTIAISTSTISTSSL